MQKQLLNEILNLVSEYVKQKNKEENDWKEGDWVKYSGPILDENEYKEAIRTLLSGWLIYGENARKFELEFAKELGKKFGVLTNSGSSANLLMVSTLTSKDKRLAKYHLPRGSKFITPVVCFPTTLNPIIQNGYEPVFVDVTLPDLNLDLDQVEKKLEEDPEIKGIIFAHVLGNPPDMDRLMALVEKYELVFLEDACDALGSTYDGKLLGSFGLMSTCSFFPAHHMTMGEGGFVATNQNQLRRGLASFRDWGRACYCNEKSPGDVTCATACGDRFKNWFPDLPEVTYDHRYVFDEIGYNIKPLDLQAAMGLEQLKKLEKFHQDRKDNFERLYEIFKPYGEYFHLPKATEKADPSWFGFLLTVKEGAPFSRHQFQTYMEKQKVQTRAYFTGNVMYHPGYRHLSKEYGELKKVFPNAHLATTSTLFLGTYSGLTEEKMNYIKEKVDAFFKELGA
jgi:CDP-6-deoxy-D-xylo-4-hexulose-3-dehydrase